MSIKFATPLAKDCTPGAAIQKCMPGATHGDQLASGAPSQTYRSGGPYGVGEPRKDRTFFRHFDDTQTPQ
jgi:hypothetical protein